MRRQSRDADQVHPPVGEHLDQHRVLPRCPRHGDAKVSLGP